MAMGADGSNTRPPCPVSCSGGAGTLASKRRLPQTTAHVRITHQSWQTGRIEGEVRANDYEWQFQWKFRVGELSIEPSLGRALIQDPLGRFLERSDYQLEPGGDYSFTIRADI